MQIFSESLSCQRFLKPVVFKIGDVLNDYKAAEIARDMAENGKANKAQCHVLIFANTTLGDPDPDANKRFVKNIESIIKAAEQICFCFIAIVGPFPDPLVPLHNASLSRLLRSCQTTITSSSTLLI
jgi:hypothetical protein